MKTLMLTIAATLFTFSTNAYSEWEEVAFNDSARFYIDKEKVKRADGNVLYFLLANNNKPDEEGYLSQLSLIEANCKMGRFGFVFISRHTAPMGEGGGSTANIPKGMSGWLYTSPETVAEIGLNAVCN